MQAQQLESHFEKEEEIIRKMMERVKSLRANVLVCMQDIDIRAKGMLFSDGILLVEKIMKYPDVEHLCLATGARLVTNIWDASEDDLGEARLVEGREIAEEEIIFFEGCKGDACTFLIRGGTPKIVNEHKRIIYSAVHSVASSFSTPFVLPGGGWMEIEIAKRLRKFANRLGTKEQLAVTSFADSLEIIPKTLAKNSGLDPIDAVLEMGVNCQGVCIDEETRIGDTMEIGIVDPLDIKEQVFSGATEIAELVLLTDGILTDKKKKRR
jgi:chaperonin GroEL (HSP60 family)